MNRPVDTDWTPQFAFTKRFWVGCVTMLVATSFLVIAIVTALDARALAQNPRTLTATVVDTHEVGSSFGAASDPKFKITYQFRFDDQALRMTRGVLSRTSDRRDVGHSGSQHRPVDPRSIRGRNTLQSMGVHRSFCHLGRYWCGLCPVGWQPQRPTRTPVLMIFPHDPSRAQLSSPEHTTKFAPWIF